jgi:hypothetical protein
MWVKSSVGEVFLVMVLKKFGRIILNLWNIWDTKHKKNQCIPFLLPICFL